MSRNRKLGSEAEDIAADYLIQKGYVIVTRRFRAKGGELDLVALDGETVVFVEVKQRTKGFVNPESAIDDRKVERIIRSACQYMLDAGLSERPLRFDLIAIGPKGIFHQEFAFGSG